MQYFINIRVKFRKLYWWPVTAGFGLDWIQNSEALLRMHCVLPTNHRWVDCIFGWFCNQLCIGQACLARLAALSWSKSKLYLEAQGWHKFIFGDVSLFSIYLIKCTFYAFSSQSCKYMCPQHGINHTVAIDNSKYCVWTVIATVCFIPLCGHIDKHSQFSLLLAWVPGDIAWRRFIHPVLKDP